MSKWLDFSANMLKQTYIKGFLDISGQGIYLRNDSSVNFYGVGNSTMPRLSIKSDTIRVFDNSNNIYVDISNHKLQYIHSLSENVQDALTSLTNATQYISTNGLHSLYLDSSVEVHENMKVNGNVFLLKDTSMNQRLYVGSDVSINGNLYVFGDASFTGMVEAVTQIDTDNSNRIATTAFVKRIVGPNDLSTFYTKSVIDVSYGNLNTSIGKLDVSYGYMNTSIGKLDVSYGNLNTSIGKLDVSYGYLNTSIGKLDVSYGNLNTSYSKLDVSYGYLNTSIGKLDVSYGNLNTSYSKLDTSLNTVFANYALLHGPVFSGTITSEGDLSLNGRLFTQGLSVADTSYNSIFGLGSAPNNIGSYNTIIGCSGALSLTSGSNNTLLGYNADCSVFTASNEITLGNSSITALRCNATAITSLSDRRDKANIEPIPVGLDFINMLYPVKFTWNMRDKGKVGMDEFGFLAQDLQEVQHVTGIHYPNLVYENNPDKLEASYSVLIPSLVKALQELHGLVQAQNIEIQTLKQRLETTDSSS